MPTTRFPRRGSMQFWPRKKAKKQTARIRNTGKSNDVRPLVFAGYKVGMVHVMATDTRPNSLTKNEKVSVPCTIIECPSLKICAINFYKKHNNALSLSTSFISTKLDKEIKRSMPLPKKNKQKLEDIQPADYDEIRAIAYTQPKLTGIGKKKPELFEITVGGKNKEKFTFLKENLGKEISIVNVFKPGQVVDARAVTKGKGTQGPVKRMGVKIRRHKSEKTKRGPGTLGPWKGQGHVMYRIAHAGQTGYHQRTEYNKQILSIMDKPEKINPKSGFQKYGVVKNPYLLVKGSIPGPRKRLIMLTEAIKPKKLAKEPFKIIQIIK